MSACKWFAATDFARLSGEATHFSGRSKVAIPGTESSTPADIGHHAIAGGRAILRMISRKAAAATSNAPHHGSARRAIVLFTRALNVDPTGVPIQYSLTRFAADRMTLLIQPPR
jgi:hypothetical protein